MATGLITALAGSENGQTQGEQTSVSVVDSQFGLHIPSYSSMFQVFSVINRCFIGAWFHNPLAT